MTALICTYLVKVADGEPWLVCWYVLGSGVLSTVCALIIASQKRNLTASTALA